MSVVLQSVFVYIKMAVTAPIDLTRAQLPETTIEWYRSVTRNRFV